MKKALKIVSLLLVVMLAAAYLPPAAFAQKPQYDAVSGATGGGGGGDDDDTPSSFGNTAVDVSLYNLTPYDAGDTTGTALAGLMESTPLFYYNGAGYTQLMYYCIKGYAYMFYLNGSSYYDYVGISYGYNEVIESKTDEIWSNLHMGTLRPYGSPEVFVGTASVDDAEGSFLTLNVSVEALTISALAADSANCVGSWDSLISRRSAEYLGKHTYDASEFDGVTSATPYSAALKEAVFDALELTETPDDPDPEEPQPEEPQTGVPAHEKTISGENGSYVLSLSVTAQNEEQTVTVPGEPEVRGSNIVLCVDVSGSISGASLENLNNAIRQLVGGMPKGSQLGLVTFAAQASDGEVFEYASQVPTITATGGETNLAPAISKATELLDNASLWRDSGNNKAIVIISDGQVCDPEAALALASSEAKQDVHFYTVNISAQEAYMPSEVFWIYGSYGTGADYGMGVLQAVSGNYLNVTVEDYSFIYRTFVYGERNPDGRDYAFGAEGAEWADVFDEITQNEYVETVSVPMSGVVITDVLSEYVELANESGGYGIEVEGTDDYTVAVSGRTVTVSFGGELEEGVTYIVRIPVKASAAAQEAANAAEGDSIELCSNSDAVLYYEYDGEGHTAAYGPSPVFTAYKQYFSLTVHYVYMDGTPALEDYTAVLPCGEPYCIIPPEIPDYTPNVSTVQGVILGNTQVTVTYIGEFLWGDADCDGDCDWADVSAVFTHLLGLDILYAQGWINANVSGTDPLSDPIDMSGVNNSLDYNDISAIVLYLLNTGG